MGEVEAVGMDIAPRSAPRKRRRPRARRDEDDESSEEEHEFISSMARETSESHDFKEESVLRPEVVPSTDTYGSHSVEEDALYWVDEGHDGDRERRIGQDAAAFATAVQTAALHRLDEAYLSNIKQWGTEPLPSDASADDEQRKKDAQTEATIYANVIGGLIHVATQAHENLLATAKSATAADADLTCNSAVRLARAAANSLGVTLSDAATTANARCVVCLGRRQEGCTLQRVSIHHAQTAAATQDTTIVPLPGDIVGTDRTRLPEVLDFHACKHFARFLCGMFTLTHMPQVVGEYLMQWLDENDGVRAQKYFTEQLNATPTRRNFKILKAFMFDNITDANEGIAMALYNLRTDYIESVMRFSNRAADPTYDDTYIGELRRRRLALRAVGGDIERLFA